MPPAVRNRCAIRHGPPNFVHLLVCNGDAAIGPLPRPMSTTNPPISVGQAAQHDIATLRYSKFAGVHPVFRIRIRDMDRAPKLAVFISAIEEYTPSGVMWSPCRVFEPRGLPPRAILYVLMRRP